ncbi:uncharacterized protein [Ptychodera flava]|uniref:uncharacterized protein n=1 Tax=Ptychodera flava TaxID=63121 RepID=UPI003969F205
MKGEWKDISCSKTRNLMCETADSSNIITLGPKTKSGAFEICQNFGLTLLTDESEAKHQMVIQFVASRQDGRTTVSWLDASISDKKEVVNSDGLALTHTTFAPNQTLESGLCIYLSTEVNCDWVVEHCDSIRYYLCEGKDDAAMLHEVLESINGSSSSNIDIINGLLNFTSKLSGVEVNLRDSVVLAQALIDIIQSATESFADGQDEMSFIYEKTQAFTETVVAVTEQVAMFVLDRTPVGSGSIVVNASSLVLHLEKDSIENICDSTTMISDASSVLLPPAESVLPGLPADSIGSRIILQLSGHHHQLKNMTHRFTTDILTLWLKDDSGRDFKVQNTPEDIGVWLGNYQPPLNETVIVGQYIESDSMTHYLCEVQISRTYHAIQILLEGSAPVNENTTAYVSFKLPNNSSAHNDSKFSVDVAFKGNMANIFVPEDNVTHTGSYYVDFDLLHGREISFKLTTTQHRCGYSVDSTRTWESGCKVSPKSTVNATLCLCNQLT